MNNAKVSLFIAAVFVALLAAGGGYIAWSNHASDQAVQKSYTPFKNTGPALGNPFSDVKAQSGDNSHE